MAYEFKLPDLGEGLTEGEIARWLVSEGQQIAEDDPLVEIQTDKTTVEIPSPAAGIVSQILAAEGDVVAVGTVIVVIGGEGTSAPAASQGQSLGPVPASGPVGAAMAFGATSQGQSPRRVQATPLVRKVAAELGVELESLVGSGAGGRITEADVRGAATSEGQSLGPGSEGRRERLRGVRRLIAEQMTRAQAIPAVTFVEECDFGRVHVKRLIPIVLQAAAAALQRFPELNARLEGEELVYLDRYDVGVAVQTEQGIVVPVVRDCATATLEELDAELQRLADGARAGTLKPEELRGSTFTVTSAGKLGGLLVTPLINHPEVAILGVHRIAPRPVVRDGEIVAAQIGHISVTFDHRVVDGARAAEFTLDVIAQLEQ